MELLEGILNRRTVRKFTGEKLKEGQLEQIVRAAMAAPSAHDRKPWRILTVENEEQRLAVREIGRWWKMLDKAAVLTVMCADPSVMTDMAAELEINSCSAALENMLLAAHALGLGAVWLGLCESEEETKKVKDILGIPQDIHIIGMAAIGVIKEAEEKKPAERYDSSKWKKEVW